MVWFNFGGFFSSLFVRMDDFFALGKEEAPDNIPMMFITMPSAKDPEAKKRHPGTNQHTTSSTVTNTCGGRRKNVLT